MKNDPHEHGLFCRKRANIEEFVCDNFAWKKIYALFMSICDEKSRQDIPATEMLNEVSFLCAQVYVLTNTLRNIWADYRYPDRSSDSRPATLVCLSLVYAVLSLTEIPDKLKSIHLKRLKQRLCADNGCKTYFWPVDDCLYKLKKERVVNLSFSKEDFLAGRGWQDKTKQRTTKAAELQEIERLEAELAEEKRLHDEARQEAEQLRQEVKILKVKMESLTNELKCLTNKPKQAETDERLPLTAFLDYAERYFTPQQNDRAKVLKEVLGDLYSQQYMTDEEKERLRKLGTKPVPVSTMTVNGPLNDIHDNEHVRAGM